MDPLLVTTRDARPSSAKGREAADTRFVRRVILLGFVLKLVAMVGRRWVIYDLYGGASDVGRYVRNGEEISGLIRSGVLPPEATTTGTTYLDFVVGAIFTITGSREIAAFVVLSLLAFLGLYLLYRAFVIGVPDGDHRRYALLIFLLPTMLFWTSSIGKEAWMTFVLGIAAYGAARVYQRMRFGYVLLGAGLYGAFMVRPHIAALFAASFAIGFLLRPRMEGVRRGWAAWLAGVAIAVIAVAVTLGSVGDELPRDSSAGGSELGQIFAVAEDRTSQGGSEFANRPVDGPIDFLHALVTVPFRPFPWEADNLQARLAGLEGLALLGLTLWSLPRLVQVPRRALRTPYMALALSYTFAFVIAFSSIGNFGILARQRAQLVPFLLVLLCIPKVPSALGSRGNGSEGGVPSSRTTDAPLIVVTERQSDGSSDAFSSG